MIKNVTVASIYVDKAAESIDIKVLESFAKKIDEKQIQILKDFNSDRVVGITKSATIVDGILDVECILYTDEDIYAEYYITTGYELLVYDFDSRVTFRVLEADLINLALTTDPLDNVIKPIGKI